MLFLGQESSVTFYSPLIQVEALQLNLLYSFVHR
uniref:Uncharacterized protein n=1 Tax=Anguilla anguilla TaxID=7936 RepID=A0A0E9QE15_ANGAN